MANGVLEGRVAVITGGYQLGLDGSAGRNEPVGAHAAAFNLPAKWSF